MPIARNKHTAMRHQWRLKKRSGKAASLLEYIYTAGIFAVPALYVHTTLWQLQSKAGFSMTRALIVTQFRCVEKIGRGEPQYPDERRLIDGSGSCMAAERPRGAQSPASRTVDTWRSRSIVYEQERNKHAP